MKSPVTGCWAKLARDAHGSLRRNKDGTPVEWHPLVDHCADVAAVFLALLDQRVIRRWLAAAGGVSDLTTCQRERLAYLALLHDVGKVNVGFQQKWRAKPTVPPAGHVSPLLQLLYMPSPERSAMLDAVGFNELACWTETRDVIASLLFAAICHHGRPVQPEPGLALSLWRATAACDPAREASAIATRAREWLPSAFRGSSLLPSAPGFQHAFNGLLTLADWIGSDESFFPYWEREAGVRFGWARDQAGLVLRDLGIAVSDHRASLGAAPPAFSAISNQSPRELQQRMVELVPSSGGSIVVLEAQTGAGKTEAALAYYLRLFHAGEVDGLYFALPTRTAATQIYGRVQDAIRRAFPDEAARPPVVLAVPGYLAVDGQEGQRLAQFEVLWPDARPEWRPRAWAAEHSKRYLAGAIVVGTVDQVLLSGLTVSHAHMRSAALGRHLLVVDEVHASDAYMTKVLEAVLARHTGTGGHALLMSATLGAEARVRLLYPGKRATPPAYEAACAVDYPLITQARPGAAAVEWPLSRPPSRRVRVELNPMAALPGEVAALAVGAARTGARVLVVRNTVRDCLATQQAIEACAGEAAVVRGADAAQSILLRTGGTAVPHHSRYSREDRACLDAAIECAFGKHSTRASVVGVATQTVQQSLDLDADLLISDLCPMDVLLQRVGRLHRHDRPRPAAFQDAQVIVLTPADHDLSRFIRADGSAAGPHGLGRVYADLRVIAATWIQLRNHQVIELPERCRELVEATTHPGSLEAVAAADHEAWARHERWILGVARAHSLLASRHLLSWDTPIDEMQFPEDGARIATRLGAEDRMVEFDPIQPGPLGNDLKWLTIPAWLVHAAGADELAQDVVVSAGSVQFRFGSMRYKYDRYGLTPVRSDERQPEEDDD